MLKDLDDFHKTPTGYITFGIVELLLAYGVGSRALDTGSLWQYALAIILFVGAVQNIVKLFKNHVELVHKPHDHRKKSHRKA